MVLKFFHDDNKKAIINMSEVYDLGLFNTSLRYK
jgi:hypothetical protein